MVYEIVGNDMKYKRLVMFVNLISSTISFIILSHDLPSHDLPPSQPVRLITPTIAFWPQGRSSKLGFWKERSEQDEMDMVDEKKDDMMVDEVVVVER